MEYILAACILYGVLAIPVMVIRKALATLKVGSANRDEIITDFDSNIARGKDPAQITSFVFHVILALIGLNLGLALVVPEFIGGIAFVGLFLLIPLTPLTVLVNAFWIYPQSIIMSEAKAFHYKTATKRLYAQHVLAWIVWVGYTIGGVTFLAGTIPS